MGDERGTTPYEKQNDEAWAEFRRQLADHCAGMSDDDLLHIEIEQAPDEDELYGAAPYLQLLGWGEGAIRAEVCSNAFLDDRFLLSMPQEPQLAELGWNAPTYGRDDEPDHGSPHWWADVELRDADRLAVMCVGALRDVFGCPHPAFLVVDGFEPTGFTAPEPGEDDEPEPEPEAAIAYPHDRDELQEMVDGALGRVYGEPVKHDADGDVPIVLGDSVLFVIVSDDEPIVELFAELVHDVADLEAAEREVAVLNRDLMFGTCLVRDDRVLLRHRLCGAPFVPAQFRMVLSRVSSDLDRIAADLAVRVGGRRFLDVVARRDGRGPALSRSRSLGRAARAAGRGRGRPANGRGAVRRRARPRSPSRSRLCATIRRPTSTSPRSSPRYRAHCSSSLCGSRARCGTGRGGRQRVDVPPHQPPLLSSQDVGEQALDLGAES